jgi:hypothetical protein
VVRNKPWVAAVSGDRAGPPSLADCAVILAPQRMRRTIRAATNRLVSELAEAVGGVGVYVVLFGVLLWSLYFAFGPQVLGLPAMIGVLVIVAGIRIFSNAGLSGLAFVVLGLFVLVMVIGMAMRLVTDGPKERESPPD